ALISGFTSAWAGRPGSTKSKSSGPTAPRKKLRFPASTVVTPFVKGKDCLRTDRPALKPAFQSDTSSKIPQGIATDNINIFRYLDGNAQMTFGCIDTPELLPKTLATSGARGYSARLVRRS